MKSEAEIRKVFDDLSVLMEAARRDGAKPMLTGIQQTTLAWVLGEPVDGPDFAEIIGPLAAVAERARQALNAENN